MMRLLTTCLVIAALGCAGCASPGSVHVVDTTGKPVSGVFVAPFDGQTMLARSKGDNSEYETDVSGNLRVPDFTEDGSPGIEGVEVSKAGYKTVDARLPIIWPLRVTLTPVDPTQPQR